MHIKEGWEFAGLACGAITWDHVKKDRSSTFLLVS